MTRSSQKSWNTDLIVHQLRSIPCSRRDRVLFPPDGRDDTTGGDPPHKVHTKLHFDVSYPGLCFHLCTERQCDPFIIFMSVSEFWPGGQLFPIFNELKTNSQERMNVVIGTAIGSATLTYEIIAVFGYLTFGSRVSSA